MDHRFQRDLAEIQIKSPNPLKFYPSVSMGTTGIPPRPYTLPRGGGSLIQANMLVSKIIISLLKTIEYALVR
jgi:hypothetical protein